MLLFFSGYCIGGEGDASFLFLLSCLRVEALSMNLVCSPVRFSFRVGGPTVSAGFSFWSLVGVLVMADLMLGQACDDGGRYTTMTTSHAASNSWRPRLSSWLGSSPGRSGSSQTPAVHQDSWKLGRIEDLETFASNSSFFRVLCATFGSWRLCSAVFVVLFSFFKGFL